MNFHVGQKVVCVDAANFSGGCPSPNDDLVEGGVYTISRIGRLAGGRAGVNVKELSEHRTFDVRFGIWRFRPLIERKTDISIFIEMLTPNKVKERA